MALIKCEECGNEASDKAASCPKCGAPITGEAAHTQRQVVVYPPKSRSMAIVLALLLGGIGAHKFYLNNPGWGFIYLIFCWTFIPAIIALIEAIVMLLTPDKSFHERYAPQV